MTVTPPKHRLPTTVVRSAKARRVCSAVTGAYAILAKDTLYRNSVILILDTGFLGIAGFLFWIISAHYYSANTIGLTTTVISACSLLSSISLLGLDNSFIRFLPKKQHNAALVNTGLTLGLIIATVVGAGYVLAIPAVTPTLDFITENLPLSLVFVSFVILLTLNTLTNGVFLAHRAARYILYGNLGLSVAKLLLPIPLEGLRTSGLIVALCTATGIAVALSVGFLKKSLAYRLRPILNSRCIADTYRFSGSNYAASLLQAAPALLIPVIIAVRLHARDSGYFYIALMIANLIYIIPNAASQSLFVEGAHQETALKQYARRSSMLIGALLVPASVTVIIAAPTIMSIFGEEDTAASIDMLRILVASSAFVAVNYTVMSILRVTYRLTALVTVNLGGTVTAGTLAYILAPEGVVMTAWAWLLAQAVMTFVFVAYLLHAGLAARSISTASYKEGAQADDRDS